MNTHLIEISVRLGERDLILASVTLIAAAILAFAGVIALRDKLRLAAAFFWVGAAMAGAIPFVAMDPALSRQIAPDVSAGGMFWPQGSFAAVAGEYAKGGEPAVRALAAARGWTVSVVRKS